MKVLILRTGILFSVISALSACSKAPIPPEPFRPVLTSIISSNTDNTAATYSGAVHSRYETQLGFRIPGKIAARMVDAGAFVKAGEVLARLDPADTELSAAAANAQLELAAADNRRYHELREKNFVSQAALDAKETAFKSAKAQSDLARNQSSYTVLRADHAGVIELVAAEVGQVVAAGQTVMRVAQTDALEVAVAIPESRMPEVRLHNEADVSLWSDEKAHYKGVLRELSQVADTTTRTYAARVSILRPDARVLLGMTANVKFLPEDMRKSPDTRVSVPLTAIFQKDGKPALWIVSADQTLSLRPVEVASYGETSATLENGAHAGERIVIAGVHKLTAGEKIKAVDQVNAPTSAPAK